MLVPFISADWKLVLDVLLKPVGGPCLLNCNFDLNDLPISLISFYRECLTLWARLNGSSASQQDQNFLKEIVWNNKNVRVNKKSLYNSDMINLAIHRVCDMLKTDGTFLTWTDLQAKGLQSENFLLWYGLINALPIKWKQLSQTNSTLPFTVFDNKSY